jgi:hypothetical protein
MIESNAFSVGAVLMAPLPVSSPQHTGVELAANSPQLKKEPEVMDRSGAFTKEPVIL